MTKLLKQMHVDSFEDIVAANAIYRPGPLRAKVNEFYCDYKLGKMKIEYAHPSMKAVLSPTYSMIVYQEQIMNLSKSMAGFTSSEADKLRKAIGKKNMELMAEMKGKFVSGCLSNGILESVALDTWNKIEMFGGYGFNRSHAACYAFLVYQTAYLKRYYTIEYMCALMSANIGDKSLERYMIETSTVLKIPLLAPDINHSKEIFTIEGRAIRTPLTFLKGVGDIAVRQVIDNQPYADFREFLTKNSKVSKKIIELLSDGGAMKIFDMSRDEMVAYLLAFKKEKKASKVDESGYDGAPSITDLLGL
jgi:DNA polymerase-3 subunit alpha